MKKLIALFLAAAMLAVSLTGCRYTSRKRFRPLFHRASVFSVASMSSYNNFLRQSNFLDSRNKMY